MVNGAFNTLAQVQPKIRASAAEEGDVVAEERALASAASSFRRVPD